MDIHPPAGAVHSIRDYCIHLSMVVVGILIALTLEGASERHHAHQLADRATREMLVEIRSNRQQIEQSVSALESLRTGLAALLAEQKNAIEAQRRHAPPPPEVTPQSNSMSFPVLANAAWDSALAMQAVGRIDLDTAEILSRIYSKQLEAKELQKNFLDLGLHFATYAGRTANDTPERMVDRLGALQQLSITLESLLSTYHELLSQYATSNHVAVDS